MTFEYFYIKTNKDWDYENKFKFGVSNDPHRRLIDTSDASTYKYHYVKLFKIKSMNIQDKYKSFLNYNAIDKIFSVLCRNDMKLKNLGNLNLIKFKRFLIEGDEGTGEEFMNKDGLPLLLTIINEDFIDIGIHLEEIDITEINKNIDEFYKKKANERKKEQPETKKYEIRDYQIQIIEYLYKVLNDNKPIYLELSTGAGKSYISYQLFNKFKPKIIIILSPLKTINKQNISDNYFNLLENDYNKIENLDTFKYDNSNNYIFSCCIQSHEKIYDLIIKHSLNDIFIWFDEADYGIENWVFNLETDSCKKFLLTDNDKIKYRLFTSASPDKDAIMSNNTYFGELYNPISIKELTNKKWLCKIKVHIFEFQTKLNKKDYVKFMLNTFIKKDRNLGISSHTTCNNAYELFIEHYKLWKKQKTNIKPFLLINKEKINELKKEKKISNDIDLGDINDFNETTKGIGYIVNQYSRGYDNKIIDILFVSDPKNSYKTNIQLVGRIIRPDGKGENGCNENKDAIIVIPTNYDNLQKDYSNIEETLKYIIYNIEIDYDNIYRTYISSSYISDDLIINIIPGGKSGIISIRTEEDDNNYEDKCKIINTILINVCKNHKWNVKGLITQLKRKNIHNNIEYMRYKNKHRYLKFPENIYESFPTFRFYDTYRPNENPYIKKEELIKIINDNKTKIDDFYKDEDKMNYIYSLTENKIPKDCSLWNFYGGNRNDYFNDD
jgi:superfamily II DNA or RNA helicase